MRWWFEKLQLHGTQQTGTWGEDMAARFLLSEGYEIVERNYRVRGGEIDIIAWHKQPRGEKTLCFVEVKTRQRDDGSAERATNWAKLARLERAAQHFCLSHRIDSDATPIQFEQVSVYHDPQAKQDVCRHYVIPME